MMGWQKLFLAYALKFINNNLTDEELEQPGTFG